MLEPLFDAELDYQPGMPPLTSDGDGTLIGSGDGAVHGPKLTGKLEWTLFEQPGSIMCLMAPVARITTADGARIRFEGRGYATRRSQSDPTWRVRPRWCAGELSRGCSRCRGATRPAGQLWRPGAGSSPGTVPRSPRSPRPA